MSAGRRPRRLLSEGVSDGRQSGECDDKDGKTEREGGTAKIFHAIPIGHICA
jgi:hypothetical protein